MPPEYDNLVQILYHLEDKEMKVRSVTKQLLTESGKIDLKNKDEGDRSRFSSMLKLKKSGHTEDQYLKKIRLVKLQNADEKGAFLADTNIAFATIEAICAYPKVTMLLSCTWYEKKTILIGILLGDFRTLNAQTIEDEYPIPCILDFTGELNGCKIFSHVDLVKVSHQIPIAREDIQKIAITHHSDSTKASV
ncbi:reverse transcriptase [Caerostris darwini]|uniref:Reverse transcriptase n=1 Tax=Caerostris darwini TaxID=1538125 RepID=A0AAV4RK72_9ARAC|nr:reverse transcriptase [Caerostris darwini]